MDNIQTKSLSTPISADIFDIESFLPVTNHHELLAIENKIQDTDFRMSLVSNLSLLVGNKDLGNSVRKIMARVFDDEILTKHSLYGFKKKSPFSKLLIYRVIIDALRTHIKYKMNTEKEIDIPLGTWLSHAPFRIKDKNKKQVTLYSSQTYSV
ncbi:uncharacterized protein LOC126551577 [Aphis gossypii]|uniref:uncharacterized protein LOC126551577 n=1 Tax=Aphis gossypii TaxID=80765 RepID=UPI0021598409|nr:uncharacterized protein LOC126551577 [Aphis gossypii]